MKQNEVRVLKHWQKKYLLEGCMVLFVLAMCFFFLSQAVEYWGAMLILAIIVAAVMFLMGRALNEALQNKAERLIWDNHKQQFGDLEFDVGGGIATEVLENHNVLNGKQARECFNVLKSENYSFEEDLFYTEHRIRWFSIRNTAFRGIIIRIKATMLAENTDSEGYLVRDDFLVEGPLKGFLARREGYKELVKLLKLLHATKMQIIAEDGEIYFWIKTPTKIFYQFNLLEDISPLPFMTRVQQFQQIAESLYETYNT